MVEHGLDYRANRLNGVAEFALVQPAEFVFYLQTYSRRPRRTVPGVA